MAQVRKCSGAGRPCSLSRRIFLQLTAMGAMAVPAGAALAQEKQEKEEKNPFDAFKATKEVARYIQKSEPSPQDCSSCHSFIPPDECQLVEGPVSPLGWCDWYSD